MKLALKTITNTEKGQKELPKQFKESVRPDLIKRAVLAIQSHKRQPYGADPEAGKRASAEVSRRRRKYRGSYGRGISRVPRKVLNRRGTQLYFVGAFAPGTVGGRRAHAPKLGKGWDQKINIKERRKAIRSAIAATVNPELVKERGHKIPDNYPFVIENAVENIKSTKDLKKTLESLGFKEELERCNERKIRPGKGKMRGRKYVTKKGPLLVVGNDCDVLKAASNILGVEVVTVESLNAELLAPGTHAGRAVLFTEKAVDRLASEDLFITKYKKSAKKPTEKNEAKAKVKTALKTTKTKKTE